MKKLASWLLMVSLIGLSITIVVLAGTGERAIPADIGCADCPPATGTEETSAWPSANLNPQVNSWPPQGCLTSGDYCDHPWGSLSCPLPGGGYEWRPVETHWRSYYCPGLDDPWIDVSFGLSCHCERP